MSTNRWLLPTIGLGAAILLLSRGTARREGLPAPAPGPRPKPGTAVEPSPISRQTTPPRPIYESKRGDPELEALLTQMADVFRSHGVDLTLSSAAEVTAMGSHHAIPPRATWPEMARTLREVFLPIRNALGFPMRLGGYRTPAYNEKVRGSANSRHMWFQAVDLLPAGDFNTAENRRRIALQAAGIYQRRGGILRMGLGVYGSPTPYRGIHVDTGWKQRNWNEAKDYLAVA